MGDIKLFVCCHRPFSVPNHPLLVPIQVGATLADSHFPGFIHDDTGDNISQKNRSYCELTAQYWTWKNANADYYGFFHYRRYLYPDLTAKPPYRIERAPDADVLDRLEFDRMQEVVPQYDMLCPIGENMHISVREHYAHAPFHHKEDLELIEDIIRKMYPSFVAAMEQHLSGTICYFGNMYIMSKPLFLDYCAWLFPILDEFDRRADLTGYSQQELRVDGYLAERLFGVYYTHRKEELRTLELPRVHFVPDRMQRWSQKLTCALLPPGSKRRSIAKRWKRR